MNEIYNIFKPKSIKFSSILMNPSILGMLVNSLNECQTMGIDIESFAENTYVIYSIYVNCSQ
jgi:hypothetical protein